MKKMILTAAAVAMISGAALADGPDYYDKIDTNKDGVISKAESQAFNDKRFDELDTNKDGNISKDERQAHRAAMKEKFAARKAAKEAAK